MNPQSVQIQNQNFSLHPSGALFWKEKSILLISDVHLGKISHFRKFGAAVPRNAIQRNFDRMDGCLQHFTPEHVIFMGDLFHSSLNKEWQLFEKWRGNINSKITLVAGNHDIISPVKYEELGIQVASELQLAGFLMTHHPEEREGFFNFCGHVHPAIRLTGLGRQSVRLRCFYKSKSQLILPAFGAFTGSFTVGPKRGCEVYALLGDAVLPVTLKQVNG
ncbi:MAG TPA: ligase-associated DNA damage response endonuclease PdeM [Pricia sp.]|nr:ligase-associated DNA damage response endonuclease PdeM [Pricia sp.]